MSHELRTPLNGVLGYAQILRRDPTINPEQRATLDAIAHCGHLLRTLINEVLDLARIETGQLDMELGPCDLPHLLHSVQEIIRPRAEARGVRVTVDIAPLVPRCIRTDATKLEQVLVNLLGNAVKFTEHGTITVRIAAPSDTQLTVDVQDTGIGIAPEHLHTIFAPFTQTARGKVAGGTGLGLAISQRLVAALGGTLEVTSTVGLGSCFTIVLPLVAVDAPPLVVPGAPSRPEMWAPVLAPGQDVTVLIADDHDIDRDVLMRMLAGAGFRTVPARDGAEALRLLRQHRMPLVFMDVDMPGMDGFDAARVLRADAMLRDTVVIAVTAHALPEVHQQILAGGYDACLTKPFRMADIFGTMARHLPVQFIDRCATAAAETAPAPASALPPALAQDAARRLRDALDIGDIMAITVIAAELSAHPDTPAHYGEAIHRYAMAFDMQALRRLVDTLDHRATNSRE
jgi:CheY-like chemotaxis protein